VKAGAGRWETFPPQGGGTGKKGARMASWDNSSKVEDGRENAEGGHGNKRSTGHYLRRTYI